MQRNYALKKEASSSIVATESALLSRIISKKENHDIITLGILSAFAQCSILESINGEQTMLKICRVLEGILCKIVIKVHKDFATYSSSNNKISCAIMLELLHRMLKASILHY